MSGTRRVAVGASLGVFLLGAAVAAPPSSYAHSGPDAVPLIRAFTLAPAAQGWTASLSIVDSDSGTALGAVDVALSGAGTAKPTPMIDGTTTGTYVLALPKAKPGPVQLRLQIRTLPGGSKVLGLNESYNGTLEAGKPWLVAGSAAASGVDGGGSNTGIIAGAATALLLVAAGSTLVLRRRRPLGAASV